MKIRWQVLFLIFLVFFISGCKSAEFSCEDKGGLWLDDSCIKATDDAGFVCVDNSECEGYCYTTKHPKSIEIDKSNGFAPSGICSTHILPLTCADTIQLGRMKELCRA